MAPTPSRPCPACDSTESKLWGQSRGYRLRECHACATVFTMTLPGPGEELDYDAYYHDGNLHPPAFVNHRLDDLVSEITSGRRPGVWLDVGFGAGMLLDAVARSGWQAHGCEVSSTAAALARSAGHTVYEGELGQLDLARESFDVVSVIEVLEHLSQPSQSLGAAWRLLKPGGILYVTTPHARGISGRMVKEAWSIVSPPEHLQLFSRQGLRRMLSDQGFRVRRMRTDGVNPYELLAHLRPGGDDRAPVDRVATGYQLNKP